ncbi:MAG: DUF5916 domain-containing protein [bacterium]
MKKLIYTVCFVLFLSVMVASAEFKTFPWRGELVLDAKLEETGWQNAGPISTFIQQEPDNGKPSSESTQVRIFFNDTCFIIGFHCFDSKPDQIIAQKVTHDLLSESDFISFYLDPYGDGQMFYVFRISAASGQMDGTVTEGVSFGLSTQWDGMWYSKVRIDSLGYCGEVIIPFKIMNISLKGNNWGINIDRKISRKNEISFLSPVQIGEAAPHPSFADKLSGIKIKKYRSPLTLIPGLVVNNEFPENNPDKYEFRPHLGLDIAWKPNPLTIINAAVLPDFALAEADQTDITNDRYEVQLPEKRAFFNERMDLFKKPIEMFYSRRVGQRLTASIAQPIWGGLKLSAKTGGTEIALLDVFTGKKLFRRTDTPDTAYAANYGTFCLRHSPLPSLSLSILTAHKDYVESIDGLRLFQRAYSTDLTWLLNRKITANALAAFSHQSESNSSAVESGEVNNNIDRMAFTLNLGQISHVWNWGLSFKKIGAQFEINEIGYLPRNDLLTFSPELKYKHHINKKGFNRLEFYPVYKEEYDSDLHLERREITLKAKLIKDNKFYTAFLFVPSKYREKNDSLGYKWYVESQTLSDASRPLSFYAVLYYGDFFDNAYFNKFPNADVHDLYGKRFFCHYTQDWHITSRIKLTGRIIFYNETLHSTRNNRRVLATFNGDFALRERILLRIYEQYLGHTGELKTNALLKYQFTSRSAFYAGINGFHDIDMEQEYPEDIYTLFYLKLSYFFERNLK